MSDASVTVPETYKLPKSIRDELPPKEVLDGAKVLWEKSRGRCALCDQPLPGDGKLVDADHKVARVEGDGGKTELTNLYLAHRSCNRSRKNLPFDLAARVIRFSKLWETQSRPSFADVVKKYVPDGNRRVEVEEQDGEIVVSFGADKRHATLYLDPATHTKYFFLNAPVAFIQNDEESQPRFIEQDHVRTLAIEFSVRPVHEPSNCRVVGVGNGIAELRQFDGQHKTTAQLVLGRTEVPMKFYYEPNEPMIQELVVQIQQVIKKRPLSTTDTLRKLDDVIQEKVVAYSATHNGRAPTEVELVEAQPKQDQAAFKKRLLSNFALAVLKDEKFELEKYASKKIDRSKPFTDTVLVNKLITPLIAQELLNEPLDDSRARDIERAAVVSTLNRIAKNMLGANWSPKTDGGDDDLSTYRARQFFYQGAIAWWLNEVLLPAFNANFPKARWKRLFLEELTVEQSEMLDGYIDLLCGWALWSTDDKPTITAFRSNTVKNVTDAVDENEYSNLTLSQQYHNS
jgi:hypothetical protein